LSYRRERRSLTKNGVLYFRGAHSIMIPRYKARVSTLSEYADKLIFNRALRILKFGASAAALNINQSRTRCRKLF